MNAIGTRIVDWGGIDRVMLMCKFHGKGRVIRLAFTPYKKRSEVFEKAEILMNSVGTAGMIALELSR